MNTCAKTITWPNLQSAIANVRDFADSLGYPKYLLAIQKYHPSGQVVRAALSTYPKEWLHKYDERKYILLDPAVRQVLQSAIPFCWDELETRSRREQGFLRDAKEHGLGEGMTIPIHWIGGELFVLSLSGAPVPVESSSRWQQYSKAYEFLCTNVSNLREILLSGYERDPVVPLTSAQREVLEMLMQGNTAKGIARSLGIHVRAVEDRLARACGRLNANSRAQAMVRALTSGQITMFSDKIQHLNSLVWHVE